MIANAKPRKPRKPRGINPNPLTPEQRVRMVYHRCIQSCTDTNHPSYPGYGGRGIYVDLNDWPDATVFIAWAFASGYEPGLSIDRIQNHGPYCKANCQWSNRKQQQRNTRHNRRFDYLGEPLTCGEILERHRGSYTTAERESLYSRLAYGCNVLDALAKMDNTYVPVDPPKKRAKLATYLWEGQFYPAKKLLRLVHGESVTDADLSRFQHRVKKGWPLADALLTPRITKYQNK